jgi:hypothetical protein
MVDLSAKHGPNTGGSIYYADGVVIWVSSILDDGSGEYDVRIEDGWYNSHKRTGEAIRSGTIIKKDGTTEEVRGRDIVKFIPRPYEEHEAEHGKPWEYPH